MKKTMRFVRILPLSLMVIITLAAVSLSLDLLGTSSAVLAQELREQEPGGPVNLEPRMQQQPPQLVTVLVFTDPAAHVVEDLAGNAIGQGVHIGESRCRGDNCNKKTKLDLLIGSDRVEFQYQFKTLQAIDPEARRLVVSGRGTISSDPRKETFLFTATIQDNMDGTMKVTYVSSRPDASFLIPKSPGTFDIFIRQ